MTATSCLTIKLPLVSLDIGSRRIGIAVSDSLGLVCHGVKLIHRRQTGWRRQVLDIAHEYGCKGIIIGLARNMDGSEGVQAADCRAAASQLQEITDLPVEFSDERLSSWAAKERLREQGLRQEKIAGLIDQTAAAIILEGYLAEHPGLTA